MKGGTMLLKSTKMDRESVAFATLSVDFLIFDAFEEQEWRGVGCS